MTTDEGIEKYVAMKVFEAGAAGECEDCEALHALGLDVETIADAELISHAAYDRRRQRRGPQITGKRARILYKDGKKVLSEDMDFQIGPRMPDESEADFLYRQMLGELIQQ